MKDLRQAAQRVLEVLVRVNASPHLQDLHHAFDEEINDLKQALAEPEQEPVSLNNGRLTQYPDGSIGLGTSAEQEQPVAWRYVPSDVWGDAIITQDPKTVELAQQYGRPVEPLYTAPPQREHITDGSPCWCNPDVIEEDGGNVIVHNYDDNWQQYAKPGETAQQCIERHRSEQDALMKLYATPRKPVELTDREILDANYADGEEADPIIAAPDSELIAFSRAVMAVQRDKEGKPMAHWHGLIEPQKDAAAFAPRRPLTDEEIWKCLPPEEDELAFARAIERAHGIGDSNE